MACALLACSAGAAHKAQPVLALTPAAVAASPRPARARPLTQAERALLPELQKDVDHLASEIGQRDVDHPWELADAADYLATELEAAGYVLERQGFEVRNGKAVVQNLSVKVAGADDQEDQSVIVTAHYDTPPGSKGVDDNASGTALLLALARSFRDTHPDCAVRFVFLVNEQEPFAGTPDMGSLRFAKQLLAAGDKVKAAIALRGVGGSMLRLEGVRSRNARGPSSAPRGVFVAGPPWAKPLSARIAQLLAKDLDVAVVPPTATEHPLRQDLGVWGLWQARLPAVLVTRDPDATSSRAVTGPDEPPLDYETMARLAVSLRSLVLEIAVSSDNDEDLARVEP
jgi:hypothetical protein